MSLINEVLEDLDAREPRPEPPDRIALVEPVPETAAQRRPPTDWTRIGIWLLVCAALLAFASVDWWATPQGTAVAPVAPKAVVRRPPPPDTERQPPESAPSPPAMTGSSAPVRPPEQQAVTATAPPVSSADESQDPAEPVGAPSQAALPDPAAVARSATAELLVPVPEDAPLLPPEDSIVTALATAVAPEPDVPVPPAAAVAEPGSRGNATPPQRRGRVEVKSPVTAAQPAPGTLDHARARWAEGRVAEAEAGLRRLLAARPGHLAGRELLAGILVRGGRDGDALSVIAPGLERHPASEPLRLMAAHIKARRQDVAGAIAVLEGARLGTPRTLELLATLYQRDGRYADAVTAYRMLIESEPGTGRYHAGLGFALESLGDGDAALRSYRLALARGGLAATVGDYLRVRIEVLEASR